jgi:hypothetical protein
VLIVGLVIAGLVILMPVSVPVNAGLVSVLLVSVSVVALPTRVSVAAGSVNWLDPATEGGFRATKPDVPPCKTRGFPPGPVRLPVFCICQALPALVVKRSPPAASLAKLAGSVPEPVATVIVPLTVGVVITQLVVMHSDPVPLCAVVERTPVASRFRLVPVAAPMFGVVKASELARSDEPTVAHVGAALEFRTRTN